MEIEYSLNQILKSLRQSNLHFSAQETPYSLYLTIRKKEIELQKQINLPVSSRDENHEIENKSLKEKCDNLENFIEALKKDLECEIDEHEAVVRERNELIKKALENAKGASESEIEIRALKVEGESYKDGLNVVKKQLKEKDKMIHDLKKDNQKLTDINNNTKY